MHLGRNLKRGIKEAEASAGMRLIPLRRLFNEASAIEIRGGNDEEYPPLTDKDMKQLKRKVQLIRSLNKKLGKIKPTLDSLKQKRDEMLKKVEADIKKQRKEMKKTIQRYMDNEEQPVKDRKQKMSTDRKDACEDVSELSWKWYSSIDSRESGYGLYMKHDVREHGPYTVIPRALLSSRARKNPKLHILVEPREEKLKTHTRQSGSMFKKGKVYPPWTWTWKRDASNKVSTHLVIVDDKGKMHIEKGVTFDMQKRKERPDIFEVKDLFYFEPASKEFKAFVAHHNEARLDGKRWRPSTLAMRMMQQIAQNTGIKKITLLNLSNHNAKLCGFKTDHATHIVPDALIKKVDGRQPFYTSMGFVTDPQQPKGFLDPHKRTRAT